jgi:DNA-binding CsgD family transcriptional regulator
MRAGKPAFGSGDERHVGRELQADAAREHARVTCLASALECLPHPILLVIASRPLQVWHANAAARRRFSDGGLLRLRDGLLSIEEGASRVHLMNAIRRAFVAGPGCPQEVELAGEPGGPMLAKVHVEAVDVDADADAGLPVSRLLLLEVDERTATHAALRYLCSQFGLTPKEAQIALGLHANGSAHDTARDAGRSIHTVRAQLKSAMHKTNTHSQAGLVALVGRCLNG